MMSCAAMTLNRRAALNSSQVRSQPNLNLLCPSQTDIGIDQTTSLVVQVSFSDIVDRFPGSEMLPVGAIRGCRSIYGRYAVKLSGVRRPAAKSASRLEVGRMACRHTETLFHAIQSVERLRANQRKTRGPSCHWTLSKADIEPSSLPGVSCAPCRLASRRDGGKGRLSGPFRCPRCRIKGPRWVPWPQAVYPSAPLAPRRTEP